MVFLDGAITAALERELAEMGLRDTWRGAAAINLAQRMDASEVNGMSGAGMAALSREFGRMLKQLGHAAPPPDHPLDELRARRLRPGGKNRA